MRRLPPLLLLLLCSYTTSALQDDFEEEQVLDDIRYITEIAWTPDGSHMFVTQKDGQVRVYEDTTGSFDYGNGKEALDMESRVCSNGERGLGGMTLHPQFGTENRWIYLYFTYRKRGNCDESSNGPSNRFARYNVRDDWTIDEDSETVFFDTPPLPERVHNAGSVNFGNDGYIYVTTGEAGERDYSRNLESLHGKIIRLTDDNQIPPTNPFVGQPGAVRCNRDGDPNESSNSDFVEDPSDPKMERVGDNGEPEDVFPLQLCQGDCDDDEDCAPGLVCVDRDDFGDLVWGCSGADDTDSDVCAKANAGAPKCLELYAIGLRNPFKMAMNPNVKDKVQFMVNDVGAELWEEMSLGGDDILNQTTYRMGLPDYGWGELEGPCRPNREEDCDPVQGGSFVPPYHFYQHRDGGASVGAAWVPNGLWPPEYDNAYLYGEYVWGKIYMVKDNPNGEENCYSCNPPESSKVVSLFGEYDHVVTVKFGPYKDCSQALYYTSISDSGIMRRVFYTGNNAPRATCDTTAPVNPLPIGTTAQPVAPTTEPPTRSPTTKSPTAAPTMLSLVSPEEAGYPGELLSWSQDCAEGIDYCGILEFCSIDSQDVFAHRLPCENEPCDCVGMSGPLIRLAPGNMYHLVLRNAAEEGVITNLHTHGLHIVGSGDGHDVVRQVAGGGNCLDYRWNITWDHPGGTYWYHAHHHGVSQRQVEGGAFGMLVVEDNWNINPDTPAWASNELLLQIMYSDKDYEVYGNRKLNEAIDIEAAQWYRLRVSIVDSDAVPRDLIFHDDNGSCQIHRVANDGIWKSSMPGTSAYVFEMTGASRADFAIRCRPDYSIEISRQSNPENLVPITYGDLRAATIRVGATADLDSRHVMQLWAPERPYALQDLTNLTVAEENNFEIKLGYDYVNGVQWDPQTPLLDNVAFDSVHEWVLHQTANHPFHLHLYHMQVVEPGGCGAHEEGEWYDSISAPANTSCAVRFSTSDIGQRCVIHCHVLFHEDNGSMNWVNVVGPGMPRNDVESFEYQCSVSFPLNQTYASDVRPIPRDQLTIVGDDGSPSSAFPLDACRGDCDDDDDCSGSLLCFQRDDDESVPGCTGEGESGKDYCSSADQNVAEPEDNEEEDEDDNEDEGDNDGDGNGGGGGSSVGLEVKDWLFN